MASSVQSLIRKHLPGALGLAGSILRDKDKLNYLTSSATEKIGSARKGLNAVKGDLHTLLDLLKAWAGGEYREVPWTTILLITAAFIYFVNPMDAIPDILPVTGFVDDAGVIGFVAASIKKDIEAFRSWRSDGAPGNESAPA